MGQSDYAYHHRHRFSELTTKKWKVERKAKNSMCQCAASTFENSCGCTALDMVESMQMTEQLVWLENQPSQMVYAWEDLKCWRTRDTALGHKAKTSSRYGSPWGERRGKRKCSTISLKGQEMAIPSSIRRTLELFQRQRWEISERRDEAHNRELFRARRYHLELNWTEFCQSSLVKIMKSTSWDTVFVHPMLRSEEIFAKRSFVHRALFSVRSSWDNSLSS